MALCQYLANNKDLEPATADQRRRMRAAFSSARALEKQSVELMKRSLNVTQQFETACHENVRFLQQNKQFSTVLLAANGLPSAHATAASASAAPTGQELEVRLLSIVQAARAVLAMTDVGEGNRASSIAAEVLQAEQVAEDDDVEVKPWPAGMQTAREQGPVADTETHRDLKQTMLPAIEQEVAPQPSAVAPWQGYFAKAADWDQGSLGGQPQQQEATWSQGPQVDLTHSIFAGLEQAALELSQGARMQQGPVAQARPWQGSYKGCGPGACPELFQGLRPRAASRHAAALAASVQRKLPLMPEAVAGPPKESPAQDRLEAINPVAAVEQQGAGLAKSTAGWGWGSPQPLAPHDRAAAQQGAPLQPACQKCAPLRPGPVASGQAEMAQAAMPPATERLVAGTSSSQRRLHSLSAGTTTLTIRNVPGRYTQNQLIKEWGPEYSYDFLYLPYSLKDHRSEGRAFVNFTSHAAALAFQRRWHGQRLTLRSRTRPLDIVMAPVQGYWANLMCTRNSLGGSKGYSDGLLPAVFHGSSRLDTRAELQKLPPP